MTITFAVACTGYDSITGPMNHALTRVPTAMSSTRAATPARAMMVAPAESRTTAFADPVASPGRSSIQSRRSAAVELVTRRT